MPRCWVIAPVESKQADLFDNVWAFDLVNDLVSIGWDEIGDFTAWTRETLRDAVAANFPGKPPQTKSLIANMLWAFYHDIQIGDVIIARRGRKILEAVGTVTGPAFHSPGRNESLSGPGYSHSNFLPVKWNSSPRNKTFPTVVFPMHTVSEISLEQYHQLVEGNVFSLASPDVEPVVEDPTAFVMEKYLEEFIVSNFGAVFKHALQIHTEGEDAIGQQYQTEIGLIDILAIDAQSGDFVVIELKKGRPSDQVVGQILRYMGWVKQNLCSTAQSVKGVIICAQPDPKLNYAISMTSHISVWYYSIAFKLVQGP